MYMFEKSTLYNKSFFKKTFLKNQYISYFGFFKNLQNVH